MSKKCKKVKKLKIDLSGWDLYHWPLELMKALTVERDDTWYGGVGLRIQVKPEPFNKAALQIATQTMEAFFGEGLYVTFDMQGLQIHADEMAEPYVIPWEQRLQRENRQGSPCVGVGYFAPVVDLLCWEWAHRSEAEVEGDRVEVDVGGGSLESLIAKIRERWEEVNER